MARRQVDIEQLEIQFPPKRERRRIEMENGSSITFSGGSKEKIQGMVIDLEGFIGYSAWSTDVPPCSGFWELKQKSARDGGITRWWYGPKAEGGWTWRDHQSPRDCLFGRMLSHEVLMQSHEWRGLAQRYAVEYPYTINYPDGRSIAPARDPGDNPHHGHHERVRRYVEL